MQFDFENDSVLRKWIHPQYLKSDNINAIRESSIAKPYMHYAVLDNFFNEDMLEMVFEHYKVSEDFEFDDKTKMYDSKAISVQGHQFLGAELFLTKIWQYLAREYIDLNQVDDEDKTSLKIRRYAPDAKGFWVHTDMANHNSANGVILTYLNKDWSADDGSLLQFWVKLEQEEEIKEVEFNFDEYAGKRLDFLTERYMMTIDLASSEVAPGRIMLLDQVIPAYNRVVFCDYTSDPAYHSVTPGNGKTRYSIVQWLY